MADQPKKQFKAPDGTLYDSIEDYYNDPLLDTDLIQCYLGNGRRKPQNDFERALLREIEEAHRQGKVLEIYPE